MAARQGLDKSMSAPISLGGLFPDSSDEEGGGGGFCNDAEESVVTLGGLSIRLRERPFHPLNANAVWPGAHALADWVRANAAERLAGRRILELGAATGALAIFLVRACGLDVTTSDVDDGEVDEAIAENFRLNGAAPPPHLAHTWGAPLPPDAPRFDVVLASDILLYVRAYPALVDTLEALCAPRAGVPVRRSRTRARLVALSLSERRRACAGRHVLHVVAAAAEGVGGVLRPRARARLPSHAPRVARLRDRLRAHAAARARLKKGRSRGEKTCSAA